MKTIKAKHIKEGDKFKSTGGHVCEVIAAQRITDRRSRPHRELMEIAYLAADGTVAASVVTLRHKVEILGPEDDT